MKINSHLNIYYCLEKNGISLKNQLIYVIWQLASSSPSGETIVNSIRMLFFIAQSNDNKLMQINRTPLSVYCTA